MDEYKRFFMAQVFYFQRKYGDQWQITNADYLDWWEKSGMAAERFYGRQRVRCRRVDKRKPWTLDNIELAYSKIDDHPHVRRPGRKPGPKSKQRRVLTVGQWLEEIGHK